MTNERSLGGLFWARFAMITSLFPKGDLIAYVLHRTVSEICVTQNGFRLIKHRKKTANQAIRQLDELQDEIERGDRILLTCDDTVSFRHSQSVPINDFRVAEKVLALELERLLPFTDNSLLKVQWLSQGNGQGGIAEQAVAKPETIADLKSFIAHKGAKVAAVGFRLKDDILAPAFLTPKGDHYRRYHEMPWRLLAAFSVCAFLATCVSSWVYLMQQRNSRDYARKSEIEILTTKARNVRDGIDQATAKLALSNAIIGKRQGSASIVSVWQELTHVLPDHSWVQQLDYKGEFFILEGVSTSAESLVSLLEASKFFEEVSFNAPVTQSLAGQGQRFAIKFKLESNP
jgi:Tfp pilus assembly protein PilN